MRFLRQPRCVIAASLLYLLACGGSDSGTDPIEPPPPPPTVGSLRAIVVNPGLGTDADGYLLTLDGVVNQGVQSADTVVFADLSPGPHSLNLSGFSANCRPPTSPLRMPSIVAGKTVTETFAADCFRPFAGHILYVRTGTSNQMFAYQVGVGSTGIGESTAAEFLEYPRASPDGMHLAYVHGSGSARISIADPDGKNVRDLTLTCGEEPAWRPDGNALAYSCATDLFVINADGTGAVNLTNTPGEYEEHPSWSPDGTQIVYEGNNPGGGLYIIDADGTNRRQLTTVSTDEGAEWSPNNGAIAFARWNGSTRQILTISIDGSVVTEITPPLANVDLTPTWSPDGSRIAFVRYLGSSWDLFDISSTGTDLTRRTFGITVLQPGWSRQ
jgi:WD40 repeat protein